MHVDSFINPEAEISPVPERRSPMQCYHPVGYSGQTPPPDPITVCSRYLIHLLDQLVDLLFSVAQVTTFDEVLELPLTEATSRAVELEGPQKVGCLLEVGADGEDLVNDVLHADHAVLSEIFLDDLVVRKREPLLVDLAVSTLCQRVNIARAQESRMTYCR
jgi:hypothetical protein